MTRCCLAAHIDDEFLPAAGRPAHGLNRVEIVGVADTSTVGMRWARSGSGKPDGTASGERS